MFKKFSLKVLGLIDEAHSKKMVASDNSNKYIAFNYDPENFVYFRTRAITADEPNSNGDMFPEGEILKSYKTFIGVGLYKDHDSGSVDKSIGKVLWADYIQDGKYVECICAIDKNLDPAMAHKVKTGIVNSVSMGASVESAECSICGNIAYNPSQLCQHVHPQLGYKGRVIGGRKCYEINRGITFVELSLVHVPADQTARVFEVYASKNSEENQQKHHNAIEDNIKQKAFEYFNYPKASKNIDAAKEYMSNLNAKVSKLKDIENDILKEENRGLFRDVLEFADTRYFPPNFKDYGSLFKAMESVLAYNVIPTAVIEHTTGGRKYPSKKFFLKVKSFYPIIAMLDDLIQSNIFNIDTTALSDKYSDLKTNLESGNTKLNSVLYYLININSLQDNNFDVSFLKDIYLVPNTSNDAAKIIKEELNKYKLGFLFKDRISLYELLFYYNYLVLDQYLKKVARNNYKVDIIKPFYLTFKDEMSESFFKSYLDTVKENDSFDLMGDAFRINETGINHPNPFSESSDLYGQTDRSDKYRSRFFFNSKSYGEVILKILKRRLNSKSSYALPPDAKDVIEELSNVIEDKKEAAKFLGYYKDYLNPRIKPTKDPFDRDDFLKNVFVDVDKIINDNRTETLFDLLRIIKVNLSRSLENIKMYLEKKGIEFNNVEDYISNKQFKSEKRFEDMQNDWDVVYSNYEKYLLEIKKINEISSKISNAINRDINVFIDKTKEIPMYNYLDNIIKEINSFGVINMFRSPKAYDPFESTFCDLLKQTDISGKLNKDDIVRAVIDKMATMSHLFDVLVNIYNNSIDSISPFIVRKMVESNVPVAQRIHDQLHAIVDKCVLKNGGTGKVSFHYIPGISLKKSYIVASDGAKTLKYAASDIIPIKIQLAIINNNRDVIEPEDFISHLSSKFSRLNDFRRWAAVRVHANKRKFSKLMEE